MTDTKITAEQARIAKAALDVATAGAALLVRERDEARHQRDQLAARCEELSARAEAAVAVRDATIAAAEAVEAARAECALERNRLQHELEAMSARAWEAEDLLAKWRADYDLLVRASIG